MTGDRRDHNRNRFLGLAMVTVFDIAARSARPAVSVR